MNWLTNLKIDFQRWSFRRKQKSELARLEREKSKAVIEADRLHNITGKQFRVLLVEGKYVVKNRRDILQINKLFPRQAKMNLVEIDKMTVYITK